MKTRLKKTKKTQAVQLRKDRGLLFEDILSRKFITSWCI